MLKDRGWHERYVPNELWKFESYYVLFQLI